MQKDEEDLKDVPVGMIEVLVNRVGWVKYTNHPEYSERSSMLLSQMYGDGTTSDGAKLSFSAAGTTLRFSFEYPGDDSDAKHHQTYDVDIKALAEALHELNKRRRAQKFADAPVEVLG